MNLRDYLEDPYTITSMKEYILKGYLRSADEVRMLHMFFSPTVVPAKLHLQQIEICIRLFPLRERQKDAYEEKYARRVHIREIVIANFVAVAMVRGLYEGRPKSYAKLVELAQKELAAKLDSLPDLVERLPTMSSPSLPQELVTSGEVSRQNFIIGIHKFVEEAMSMVSYPKGLDRVTHAI